MKTMKPVLLILAAMLFAGVPVCHAAREGAETAAAHQAPAASATGWAPAHLALALVPRGVQLTWRPPPREPERITGYEIARATAIGGPYLVVGTVGKGVNSFLDTTAAPENIYYYKVRAVTGKSRSSYSKPVAGELSRPFGQ